MCYAYGMTEESTTKRSRGRPPVASGERTTSLPAIKVGMSMRKEIDFYAGAAGMSVSAYVRQAIIDRLAAESALSDPTRRSQR